MSRLELAWLLIALMVAAGIALWLWLRHHSWRATIDRREAREIKAYHDRMAQRGEGDEGEPKR